MSANPSRRSAALLTVLNEAQHFAEQLPLPRRAALYRGLAEICASAQERAEYMQLAAECEALRKHEARIQTRLHLEGLEGDGK